MIVTQRTADRLVAAALKEGRIQGFEDGVRRTMRTVVGVIDGEIIMRDDERKAAPTRWARRKIEGGLEALLDIRSDFPSDAKPENASR